MKRKRKGGLIWPLLWILAFLLIGFIGFKIGNAFFAAPSAQTQAQEEEPKNTEDSSTKEDTNGEEQTPKSVTVTIPEGASTKDIASILKENGLIKSTLSFRFKSRTEGYDGTYKHGVFEIPEGSDATAIMKILQTATIDADLIKVTIPEGYTALQIGALLEEKEITTQEAFITAMNEGEYDYTFTKDLPEREYRLEGYLFPETYFFKKDTEAAAVVNKMLETFDAALTQDDREAINDRGMTIDEAVIVASIVESEIKAPEERATAAGVIYNRLEKDMPLQMDSTVLYAQGLKKEQVTYEDLEVDSPYNTYQNKGLPVGPISNPGKEAITAAIFPEDNNYIYYVLKDRTSGTHFYTDDYDAFLEAKEEYKAQFNEA